MKVKYPSVKSFFLSDLSKSSRNSFFFYFVFISSSLHFKYKFNRLYHCYFLYDSHYEQILFELKTNQQVTRTINYKIRIVQQQLTSITDFFYWVTNTQMILANLTNVLI